MTQDLLSCHCAGALARSTARDGLSRRRFIAGSTAVLGLNALVQMPPPAFAQAKPHRIDVHHHVSPPSWLDAVKKARLDNPPIVNWSVQKSLDDMDQAGTATAVVSPCRRQRALRASRTNG